MDKNIIIIVIVIKFRNYPDTVEICYMPLRQHTIAITMERM